MDNETFKETMEQSIENMHKMFCQENGIEYVPIKKKPEPEEDKTNVIWIKGAGEYKGDE